MDYKEKLKAIINSNKTPFADIATFLKYFPELKESEDKRMIQYFKDLAPFDKADELYEKYGFSHKDAIAWLEKKGEHNSFSWTEDDEAKVKAMCEEGNLKPSEREWLNNLRYRVTEKNPTDKVEPKFHEGDWVVYCNDDVDLITGIEEKGYCINNSGYIPFVCESDMRLWTIEDAKDGDVLVASDDSIFLFKGRVYSACKHYVALTTDGAVKFNEGLEHYWETVTAVHPATKEQRDLLFKKMHDAGYEWDAEHKQLKKIEQNPAWSEEDEKIIIELVGIFESAVDGGYVDIPYRLIKDYIRVLKSCLPQTTWKPSEEMLEALYRVIPENVMEKSEDDMLLDKLYQGLKYGKVLSEK